MLEKKLRPSTTGKNKTQQPGRGGISQRGPGKAGPTGPAWPILKRLLGYMRPHAVLLGAVFLASLLTTAVELAPPWIIRLAIDRYMQAFQVELVWWAAGGLLALSLLQGGIDFLRLYLTAYAGQRVVFEIRNAVFRHLSRLSFSYYDKARTGDLMARVTSDIDVLSNFFGRAAVIVWTNLLILAGILAVLLAWNGRLGLLYLGLLPLIMLGLWAYAQRVRPAWGRVRRQLAALTAAFQQSLAGILVVKLFGREAFEQKRVDRQNQAVLQANVQTARIAALWMPYASVVMGVGTGLVLWVGGRNVIAGVISLGMLVGFTTYIQMLLRPIRQTGMMLNVVMQSLAAAERIFEVLDTQPDVQDAPGAYPLPAIEGHVRFEGVSFSYAANTEHAPDGAYALREVTFEAAPGEMVALVGPSGAGKTSLVYLLPRFYCPQAGRITIDGHNTAAVTVQSLRDAIGIVLQSVFLFDASIGENIAYGSPHTPQHEIERVARIVQMHDFIQSLPMGYGTPVGERGVRLSGGQQQRLALARVLLTDPHILILDEPTSSVDANTEQRMQQALEKVRTGRTTFVIAHRLWTIQHADQILVLNEGQIVERARSTEMQSAHQALLAAGGFYAELYRLQFESETLPAAPAAAAKPAAEGEIP